MSDHWDPPHILDGKLEPEVRDSDDERVPLYSIAISLKRIADKLTADDHSPGDRFAEALQAALARAAPPPGEPPAENRPAGPVINGRTVKVGDALRLRSGAVRVVRGVVHDGPGTSYPWRIDTDPDGWTLYALGGRYWAPRDGEPHDLDIVGFVDEPETAPAPVDLSQLRPGDAIRFAGGRLWLVREVGPVGDGYYVTAVDAWTDRLHVVGSFRTGHPTAGYFGPPIVEIIKGDRNDGSA